MTTAGTPPRARAMAAIAGSGERIIRANGAELCIETFGKESHPAVLLIHGACASMLWWEEELCRRIAAHDRFVIRYDNRDTGRSTTYPPGRPGYTLTDMARDAVGILDVLGIDRAHVVGRSMSGAIALVLGVDHPDRVASLTFVSTTTGREGLPPMSPEFLEVSFRSVDPCDRAAVASHVLDLARVYAGGSPAFDEGAMRALIARDLDRCANAASTLGNHFAIEFDGPVLGGFADVRAPTLVVHGGRDPVFPLPHGEALRDAIPGAELLVLDDAGHDLPERYWDVFADRLARHSADV